MQADGDLDESHFSYKFQEDLKITSNPKEIPEDDLEVEDRDGIDE
jgi:hypothetical protein